jgi:hypothetical protein
VAAHALARTVVEVVPERVEENGGAGCEDDVGFAMGGTESAAGRVEDARAAAGVLLDDLEAPPT